MGKHNIDPDHICGRCGGSGVSGFGICGHCDGDGECPAFCCENGEMLPFFMDEETASRVMTKIEAEDAWQDWVERRERETTYRFIDESGDDFLFKQGFLEGMKHALSKRP